VQFNPLKRTRFGLKYYSMCKSSSGYCQQFRLKDSDSELPSHEAGVMEMMAPCLSEGYKGKGKVVLLHAMEALEGKGDVARTLY
jgi:hypothetical protein